MIAAAIAACEAAFWVLLLAGLTARYVAGRARLSVALLASVPVADFLLLAVTAVDLARGTPADWTHGLAAVYLGFGIAFGPLLVAAADRRFARRYTGAVLPPATEPQLALHWRLWRRCLLACGLAATVLGVLVLIAGDPEQTRALWAGGGWFAQLGAVSVLWLALGPLWTATQRTTKPV